jgi:hypothetical protein
VVKQDRRARRFEECLRHFTQFHTAKEPVFAVGVFVVRANNRQDVGNQHGGKFPEIRLWLAAFDKEFRGSDQRLTALDDGGWVEI